MSEPFVGLEPGAEEDLESLGRFYAEQGFAIAWTASNNGDADAKRVTTRDWQHTKPLADPDFAAGLFKERGKTRNPAIVLRPSGLVAIECDGADDLARVEELALPPTLTARSSAPDRQHRYFRPPAELEQLPFVAFRFETGELTADSGRYFVAPPALHPSGAVYSFLPGLGPGEVAIAEVPEALYLELCKRARRAASVTPAAELGERIPQGRRRNAMLRVAGKLKRAGLAADEILPALRELNKRCDPPLDEDELGSVAGRSTIVPAERLGADAAAELEEEQVPEAFLGLSHAEVLDLRFEGERHLIAELAELGTVGLIAGVPETHKSHLAQAIACAIALGKGEVLGRAVEVQGPVGFFWQDDSRRNEAERVQTLSAARSLPRDLPVRWFLNEGLELPRDLDRLRATVERDGFRLVVLDSFYNFVRLGNGLSLKDEAAAEIVAALKREVCDGTGCTVLIVDHAPWPSESNRGQRRAYGSVLKSAAIRWAIFLERQGSKLHVSANGNNVRGLPRTPVVWDEDAHELRLVAVGADAAADEEALEWVIAYVEREHAKDGRGVPRGEVETAYHEAHDGHGRNRARRVISAQLGLAEALATYPGEDEWTGEDELRLARGGGEVRTGVYLYPASHAPSPLAATGIGEGGQEGPGATNGEPLAGLAAHPKGGEDGGEEGRGGDPELGEEELAWR